MKATMFYAVAFLVLFGTIAGPSYATGVAPDEPVVWVGKFPNKQKRDISASVLIQHNTVTFKVSEPCGKEPNAKFRTIEWQMGDDMGTGSGCHEPELALFIPSLSERDIVMLLPKHVIDAINRTGK